MKKPRGNPNWAKRMLGKRHGVEVTEFEKKLTEFNVTPGAAYCSKRMASWARKHYRSRYIPEDLLTFWGIQDKTGDLL